MGGPVFSLGSGLEKMHCGFQNVIDVISRTKTKRVLMDRADENETDTNDRTTDGLCLNASLRWKMLSAPQINHSKMDGHG